MEGKAQKYFNISNLKETTLKGSCTKMQRWFQHPQTNQFDTTIKTMKDRWMDEEVVVHIYNGILFSHKKELIWVRVRWMNLEPVIQSEVGQQEKNKYCVLTYIYMESRKMALMNICGEGRKTQIQKTNLWTQWGKEKVGQVEKAASTYTHYHL